MLKQKSRVANFITTTGAPYLAIERRASRLEIAQW